MAKIYRYKATFPQSKVFFREYEIKEDTTLFALHQYLLDDLEFAPDQMIAFMGLDERGKQKSLYGLFDMGNGTLDGVTIGKTISKGETVLLYVFDIQKNKHIRLTLEGEAEPAIRASYPRLTAERGRVPGQFDNTYDNLDVLDEHDLEDDTE